MSDSDTERDVTLTDTSSPSSLLSVQELAATLHRSFPDIAPGDDDHDNNNNDNNDNNDNNQEEEEEFDEAKFRKELQEMAKNGALGDVYFAPDAFDGPKQRRGNDRDNNIDSTDTRPPSNPSAQLPPDLLPKTPPPRIRAQNDHNDHNGGVIPEEVTIPKLIMLIVQFCCCLYVFYKMATSSAPLVANDVKDVVGTGIGEGVQKGFNNAQNFEINSPQGYLKHKTHAEQYNNIHTDTSKGEMLIDPGGEGMGIKRDLKIGVQNGENLNQNNVGDEKKNNKKNDFLKEFSQFVIDSHEYFDYQHDSYYSRKPYPFFQSNLVPHGDLVPKIFVQTDLNEYFGYFVEEIQRKKSEQKSDENNHDNVPNITPSHHTLPPPTPSTQLTAVNAPNPQTISPEDNTNDINKSKQQPKPYRKFNPYSSLEDLFQKQSTGSNDKNNTLFYSPLSNSDNINYFNYIIPSPSTPSKFHLFGHIPDNYKIPILTHLHKQQQHIMGPLTTIFKTIQNNTFINKNAPNLLSPFDIYEILSPIFGGGDDDDDDDNIDSGISLGGKMALSTNLTKQSIQSPPLNSPQSTSLTSPPLKPPTQTSIQLDQPVETNHTKLTSSIPQNPLKTLLPTPHGDNPTTAKHDADTLAHRRSYVIEMIKHSYKSYSKKCLEHDLINPSTGKCGNLYGTSLLLIDSLSTLYLIDARDEIEKSVHFLINEWDIEKGFDVHSSTFELGIRYLGGITSYIELSGDLRVVPILEKFANKFILAAFPVLKNTTIAAYKNAYKNFLQEYPEFEYQPTQQYDSKIDKDVVIRNHMNRIPEFGKGAGMLRRNMGKFDDKNDQNDKNDNQNNQNNNKNRGKFQHSRYYPGVRHRIPVDISVGSIVKEYIKENEKKIYNYINQVNNPGNPPKTPFKQSKPPTISPKNPPNAHLPLPHINLSAGSGKFDGWATEYILSELGTLQLELIAVSDILGNPIFYELGEAIMRHITINYLTQSIQMEHLFRVMKGLKERKERGYGTNYGGENNDGEDGIDREDAKDKKDGKDGKDEKDTNLSSEPHFTADMITDDIVELYQEYIGKLYELYRSSNNPILDMIKHIQNDQNDDKNSNPSSSITSSETPSLPLTSPSDSLPPRPILPQFNFPTFYRSKPPHIINTSSGMTFGGLGDSFFEVLLKQWILLGKNHSFLQNLYLDSVRGLQLYNYFEVNGIGMVGLFQPNQDELYLPGLMIDGGQNGSNGPKKGQIGQQQNGILSKLSSSLDDNDNNNDNNDVIMLTDLLNSAIELSIQTQNEKHNSDNNPSNIVNLFIPNDDSTAIQSPPLMDPNTNGIENFTHKYISSGDALQFPPLPTTTTLQSPPLPDSNSLNEVNIPLKSLPGSQNEIQLPPLIPPNQLQYPPLPPNSIDSKDEQLLLGSGNDITAGGHIVELNISSDLTSLPPPDTSLQYPPLPGSDMNSIQYPPLESPNHSIIPSLLTQTAETNLQSPPLPEPTSIQSPPLPEPTDIQLPPLGEAMGIQYPPLVAAKDGNKKPLFVLETNTPGDNTDEEVKNTNSLIDALKLLLQQRVNEMGRLKKNGSKGGEKNDKKLHTNQTNNTPPIHTRQTSTLQLSSEHLNCFAGGMLGLGVFHGVVNNVDERQKHLYLAEQLTIGCSLSYLSSLHNQSISSESFSLLTYDLNYTLPTPPFNHNIYVPVVNDKEYRKRGNVGSVIIDYDNCNDVDDYGRDGIFGKEIIKVKGQKSDEKNDKIEKQCPKDENKFEKINLIKNNNHNMNLTTYHIDTFFNTKTDPNGQFILRRHQIVESEDNNKDQKNNNFKNNGNNISSNSPKNSPPTMHNNPIKLTPSSPTKKPLKPYESRFDEVILENRPPKGSPYHNSDHYSMNPAMFRSLLRPETVESLYILHSITKSPIYRDIAWYIAQAIHVTCSQEYGYTAVAFHTLNHAYVDKDVLREQNDKNLQCFDKSDQTDDDDDKMAGKNEQTTGKNKLDDDYCHYHPHGFYSYRPEYLLETTIKLIDQQDSWFIAETLKYLYLIFTDDDDDDNDGNASRIEHKNEKKIGMSDFKANNLLDNWVFTTEAHLLRQRAHLPFILP